MGFPEITLDHRQDRRGDVYGAAKAKHNIAYLPKHLLGSAECSPIVQARSKKAEIAVAIWDGQDPDEAVDCRIHRGDPGWDIECRLSGKLLNVKHSVAGTMMIWPDSRRHVFWAKEFDYLVLVNGLGPTFTLRGWIGKTEFFKMKSEVPAGGDSRHPKLRPGTWWLIGSLLHPMPERELKASRYQLA